MSRRDILVNALLGALLLSVFLLPVFLAVVVGAYVLDTLDQFVKNVFPEIANPEVMFVGVLLVSSLVSVVRHVWKRRWRNAFLSFVILPAIASIFLADVHSPFGFRAPFWVFLLFPIFAIPEDSDPTRSQFFLAASAVCVAIAINTGLLGSAILARIMAACVMTALFTWFVIHVRQGWGGPKNPDPEDPLSPNHA